AWQGTDNFTERNQWSRVYNGTYTLSISDANACVWSTSVFLDQPTPLVLDLDANSPLELGDSVQLNTFVNQVLDTFYWSPSNYLSCLDCLDPVATPLQEITYTLTVVDENACQVSDQVLLSVRKSRDIYFPSAFSPNGDGNNDFFTVFGSQGVAQVNYLRVFNRWGALVYERRNFQPDDLPRGWDGTFRNEAAAMGVYIYIAEVQFIDGWTELYQGDLTLLR
ncbi:MAG: gliding motility-associated C-terminal domain-containing protein, partial [Bacteroidota bacterium]